MRGCVTKVHPTNATSRRGVTHGGADPALHHAVGQRGLLVQQALGQVMHAGQQAGVAGQVGNGKPARPVCRVPSNSPGPRSSRSFGDDETIVGFAHGLQALARHLRERRLVQQHAARYRRTTPHAAAQLVQLGQAEAFGVLDHHQRGVRYVHAHFDDGGRHQQVDLPGLERHHRGQLSAAFRRPCTSPTRTPGSSACSDS